MCLPGYHHNGFMATPELGHRMYGYTLFGRIALWSHHSAQTASSGRWTVQIVKVPQGDSPNNPREYKINLYVFLTYRQLSVEVFYCKSICAEYQNAFLGNPFYTSAHIRIY